MKPNIICPIKICKSLRTFLFNLRKIVRALQALYIIHSCNKSIDLKNLLHMITPPKISCKSCPHPIPITIKSYNNTNKSSFNFYKGKVIGNNSVGLDPYIAVNFFDN